MAATAGTLSVKLLTQIEDGEPTEIGQLEVELSATIGADGVTLEPGDFYTALGEALVAAGQQILAEQTSTPQPAL